MITSVTSGLAPVDARDIFREAEQLEGQQMHAEAADRYLEFAADQPKSGMVSVALMAAAWGRIHSREPLGALSILDRLEESGGHLRMMDMFLYTRGVAAKSAGKVREAVESFESLAEGYPASPLSLDAEMLRAESLMTLKRYAEAVASFDRLGEMGYAPRNIVAARYEAHLKLRDYEAALADVNVLLTLGPENESEELLFAKVGLEERLGYEYGDALREYIAAYPSGRYAARAHRKLADLAPPGFFRWVELRAAVEKGDREPYESENRLLLAESNLELGDTPKAVAGWKNLVLRNAASDEAKSALARLNSLQGAAFLMDSYFVEAVERTVREKREELVDAGVLPDLEELVERSREVGRALRETSQGLDLARMGIADEQLVARAREALGYSTVLRRMGPFRVLVEPLPSRRGRHEDYLRPLPGLLSRALEKESRFQIASERDRLVFAAGEESQVDIVVSFEPALYSGGIEIEVVIRYPRTGAAFLAKFRLTSAPGIEEFEEILPEIISRIR